MTKNDVISADDHKATFEILAYSFLDDIVQLFTFLLFVNHEFLLQLDLKEFKTKNKSSSSSHVFLRIAR